MDWAPQQVEAIEAVRRWRERRDRQVFRLFGYAGTGKTTIAIELAEPGTLFAAFTGKAAYVMRSKGCHDAKTIHQSIYKPVEKSTEKLQKLEAQLARFLELPDAPENRQAVARVRADIKREEDAHRSPSFVLNEDGPASEASLIIIDEVSMVDRRMGEDLLSFEKPILVLGDRAQLPPVGGGGFFTKGRPDVELTEIHRQAAESPVLQIATAIRQGRRLEAGSYGDSRICRVRDIPIEEIDAADQVIVGTNKSRKRFNAKARVRRGIDCPIPVEGDRLICLKNNHEVGLLNGAQFVVRSCESLGRDLLDLKLVDVDTGLEQATIAHAHYFQEPSDPKSRELDRSKELKPWEYGEADHFDFAYAVTCHKAQGSQWDRVLVRDESGVFRQDARAWKYTAVTRAAEQVTIAT